MIPNRAPYLLFAFPIIVSSGCSMQEGVNESVAEPVVIKKNQYQNLCTIDEKVLLSFNLENSSKILSTCVLNSQPDALIYRFGIQDDIEFEFPEDKTNSWSQFTYSYYLRGGGLENDGLDLNYLEFKNDQYEYQIYEEYVAQNEHTDVGVRVINRETNEEIDMQGVSESVEGSLVSLRESEKIEIKIQ